MTKKMGEKEKSKDSTISDMGHCEHGGATDGPQIR